MLPCRHRPAGQLSMIRVRELARPGSQVCAWPCKTARQPYDVFDRCLRFAATAWLSSILAQSSTDIEHDTCRDPNIDVDSMLPHRSQTNGRVERLHRTFGASRIGTTDLHSVERRRHSAGRDARGGVTASSCGVVPHWYLVAFRRLHVAIRLGVTQQTSGP